MKTFLDKIITGELKYSNNNELLELCDDYVDMWHKSPQTITLTDFLGFDNIESIIWSSLGSSLPIITHCRIINKPLKNLIANPKEFIHTCTPINKNIAKEIIYTLYINNYLK